MNALTVTGVSIQQDDQGRYCLNDLHAAAGGEVKHEPHRWLRNSQTKALIDAIARRNFATKFGGELDREFPAEPVSISPGRHQTTYVVKQLVYAYAMWISPEFNLAVIEAYDALVNGEYLQPLARMESYWFERREFWPLIRPRVLAGERYRDIADSLDIKRPRVGNVVKAMIFAGVLDPLKVAAVQHGPARKAALRYAEQLGLLKPAAQPAQLSFWEAQQ